MTTHKIYPHLTLAMGNLAMRASIPQAIYSYVGLSIEWHDIKWNLTAIIVLLNLGTLEKVIRNA